MRHLKGHPVHREPEPPDTTDHTAPAPDDTAPDDTPTLRATHGQPFDATGLVIAQVGWRDRDTCLLYTLSTALPRSSPITPVYEVVGSHNIGTHALRQDYP
jgi:hypothetical protein